MYYNKSKQVMIKKIIKCLKDLILPKKAILLSKLINKRHILSGQIN